MGAKLSRWSKQVAVEVRRTRTLLTAKRAPGEERRGQRSPMERDQKRGRWMATPCDRDNRGGSETDTSCGDTRRAGARLSQPQEQRSCSPSAPCPAGLGLRSPPRPGRAQLPQESTGSRRAGDTQADRNACLCQPASAEWWGPSEGHRGPLTGAAPGLTWNHLSKETMRV